MSFNIYQLIMIFIIGIASGIALSYWFTIKIIAPKLGERLGDEAVVDMAKASSEAMSLTLQIIHLSHRKLNAAVTSMNTYIITSAMCKDIAAEIEASLVQLEYPKTENLSKALQNLHNPYKVN